MYLIVSGIESSALFFRSTSKRFSISSVMATLYFFIIGRLLNGGAMIRGFHYAHDSGGLIFINLVCTWWPFIVLLTFVFSLWQESNKQGLVPSY